MRDDLQDQDEKVRKLVAIIQRHPEIMGNVDQEIETTGRHANKESVISSALPSCKREPQDDSLKMSHLR